MLIHGWWECKSAQPVWKTFWQHLLKLHKAGLITSSSVPGIHPTEVHICMTQKPCTKSDYRSTIHISQNCKITQRTIDSRSGNEKNELLLQTTIWMNKWKKPEVKEYIWYNSIYVKLKQTNLKSGEWFLLRRKRLVTRGNKRVWGLVTDCIFLIISWSGY